MTTCFELPEECNVYQSENTQLALRQWVAEQSAPETNVLLVSAARVAEVDGTAIQLLASLGQPGVRWQLTEASEVFAKACTRMGLTDWLPENAREQV